MMRSRRRQLLKLLALRLSAPGEREYVVLADVHRGEGEECTASLRPYNRAQAADLYALLENERSETPLPPPASMAPDEHDAEGVAALSRAHARLAASGGITASPGAH